jgi:tripartite ATP-independent transporter DctM subunit
MSVGLRRDWTRTIDAAIGSVVEPICAVMLVIEVVVLGCAVFWRYVLRSALVWSDEVAVLLLLWMAMLGAVTAFRRGEHVRLAVVVRRASPHVAHVLDVIGSVVVAIFALELLPASRAFLIQEQTNLTPPLNIPNAYAVAAVVVGLSLILIVALLRLIDAQPKVVGAVMGIAVVLAGTAYALRDHLAALGNGNLVLFFVVLVGACVAIGIPIAFAFGFATLSYLALTTTVPLSTVVGQMDEGISNLILLAIPLFIVLGLLMESAGIAKRLVDALASLVGHVRGGLGIVLVFAMFIVSGISGSKAADMAAVAPVLLPEMERRGTPRAELVALLASSSAMSETIPPSLVLIIIGSVTGVSIGALFVAGMLPAVLAALCLLVVVLWRSRAERGERPARAPLATIARALVVALPGFLLPALIRATILGGVATATEVSTVGIVYTVLVGIFVYREFHWRRLYPTLRDASSLTGAIMLILATATAMAWSLTQSGFAQQLADALSKAPGGTGGFIALSIVLFGVLGSVLEGIPAVVLFGPLLFPIAKQLGINEVYYAILAVLSMGIGLFSPPLGAGYYAACAIGKLEPDLAVGRVVPYLLAIAAALAVVACVPWLATGLLVR